MEELIKWASLEIEIKERKQAKPKPYVKKFIPKITQVFDETRLKNSDEVPVVIEEEDEHE